MEGTRMAKTVDKLAQEIHDLPDVEKLQLVDGTDVRVRLEYVNEEFK